MNQSNEGVQPPYFDPNLNAGSLGYNPLTDPGAAPVLFDAQPPQGWYSDQGTAEGYAPDPLPLGVPGGINLQDIPIGEPNTPPTYKEIDPSTLGFFEGSSPYDGGYNTGLGAGGYGAPGMFGRRRANL
jgi:hypothetical protein